MQVLFSIPFKACLLICRLFTSILTQVLFSDGKFQWKRLENLIMLAREGGGSSKPAGSPGLDLSDTVRDAVRVLLLDERLRTQVGALSCWRTPSVHEPHSLSPAVPSSFYVCAGQCMP